MEWIELQQQASQVLQGGLSGLLSSTLENRPGTVTTASGNYLLFAESEPLYIGQALNLRQRLSTHQRSKKFEPFLETLGFRTMEVAIGRKEIEEYGMFSLKTPLNKSHRNRVFNDSELLDQQAFELWGSVQNQSDKLLMQALEHIEAQLILPDSTENSTLPGIYIVRRNNEIIYIGESLSLVKRINVHQKTTRFSVFRRSVAKAYLGFELKTKAELGILESQDKKRFFLSPEEELQVNQFVDTCSFWKLPVSFGRFELEDALIKQYAPQLNRKGKK